MVKTRLEKGQETGANIDCEFELWAPVEKLRGGVEPSDFTYVGTA